MRRFAAIVALVVTGFVALWVGRSAGTWLIRDDGVQPADALLVSIGGGYEGAVEAARLQRTGVAPRLVVTRWADGPDSAAADLQALGVWVPTPPAVVQAIFERSGVPPAAIERIDREVNGTGPDIAALGTYARARGFARVLVLTSRSHSRRVGWLLERALPAPVTVMVHSPSADDFDPAGWWRSRDMTREVLIECLRWINAVILRDPWQD